MKSKYWIIIGAFFMLFIGVLRGIGGIAIFMQGNQLDTVVPIIASPFELKVVAVSLLTVAVLLILVSIRLMRKQTRKIWIMGWIVLIVFLLGGVLNGFLLYGQPIDQGQKINIIAALIVGIFLFLGRKTLHQPDK